ncbi:uncharacterized protein LOC115622445 [Scaptodrosophila lebanonensis]|uniref:Uncharacterized protein LOC115622445 n=1 Tax=Drosophila lebanonensis TaxID=7225 RepID=A0A6J2T5P6_DROLE|nr:uncharacterized protein LOC115622445 [Scaptodrosophila lebanonensis]
MTPFPVLYKFLHFLRIIFHYSGLLRIYYDKPKQRYYHQRSFCQYMPIVLLVLISIMHLVWRCRVEIQNELFNSLVPGSRPPRDNFELFRQFFSDIVFIITFIGACIWQDKLWCIVNEAQLAYKKLRPYLGNKWQCSFLLLALCLLLIGLLVVMCAYGIWMDWPHWADDGGAPKVLNFLMLFVHLIFATIMALHAIYHLMSAALLQTINNRIRRLKQPDKQLKVIGHVLIAQPLLKKANEYAGRCWSFVVLCSTYDVNDLIQQQKSEDDRIDEADWNGQDPEAGHAELLHHAALILAWHLAMMLVLLCGAHTHQKEHQKLIDSIWEVHEYVGDESLCFYFTHRE